jgi:hypothetical protein
VQSIRQEDILVKKVRVSVKFPPSRPSAGEESNLLVASLLDGFAGTRLVYAHDMTITGLVDAQRVGSDRASSDVV